MAWAGATPTAPTSQVDDTAGTTITTGSVTLTAGRLYLIGIIGRRGDSVDFVAPSSVLCNGTQSFAIADATDGIVLYDTSSSSRKGMWVGYCIPAGSVTGTIVATFANSHTNLGCILVEVSSGFDSGSPFLQVDKLADEDGTGTSSTLTFGSSMASDSLVVAFYGDEGTGTLGPGTGYTELAENAASGAPVLAAAYNTAPDTTFDFSYSLGQFVGAIGVEVKAAAGGAVVGGPIAGGKLAGGVLTGRLAH